MAGGMESEGAQGTLASTVYGQLRRDVLAGHFRPGERLRIDGLRERYAVGATPIREALNRLSAEDLVLREDQKGFRVAPLSLGDLDELVRTRCWMNEVALREAIRNGDTRWEEGIVLAEHHLSRTPPFLPGEPRVINPDWSWRHRAFHMALIAACSSRWLRDFYGVLIDRAERYRHLSVAGHPPARDVAGEHRAIAQAAIARDLTQAIRLLNDHMTRTGAIVARSEAPPLAAAAHG